MIWKMFGLIILLCAILGTNSSLANENVTQLTSSSTLDCFWSWSPDGRKIAFTSNHSGISDIWAMDSDGDNKKQLTTDRVSDWFSAWSPDGKKIAFTSDPDGNIWVIAIEEMITPTTEAVPTSTPMADTPAFDAAITISGLLIAIYIMRRR